MRQPFRVFFAAVSLYPRSRYSAANTRNAAVSGAVITSVIAVCSLGLCALSGAVIASKSIRSKPSAERSAWQPLDMHKPRAPAASRPEP